MKCSSLLIFEFLLALQVWAVIGRSHHGRGRHGRHHEKQHFRNGRHHKQGRAGPLLPPPTSDSAEDSEEARGLRGQANALLSLQKTLTKCTVEGSYGIQGECSKYMDCAKTGLIPSSKYCPSGKFFDHLQRTCIKSSDAQCKDVCHSEGQLLADPIDPHSYLKCMKGVPMPQVCEDPSQVFSAATGGCAAGADEEDESESDEDE